MTFDNIVAEACRKIKGTFLSIINCGLYNNGLNPITSRQINNSVPAGIWCDNDVGSTSMRRHHVASTLIRRHFGTKCPLGHVVLPKALYGSELWSRLLPNDILSLERAHRFCIKFMQCLPRGTSTDVALTLLDSNSIEVEIDRRKLVFFNNCVTYQRIYV